MCFKELSISHFVAFAVLQHVGKHDPIPQTTTQAPCQDHSHRSGHLEDVRHRLPPPLHRGDPPLPTLSQSGQIGLWRTSVAGRRRAYTSSTTRLSANWGSAFPPQGSVISPALFNHFVSDCSIPDVDMTPYADDFTLLASAPSIVKAETSANQLCAILVRWADGEQLAIAPQKSSVTLFTSVTHQPRLNPQERIGDAVPPLNRTPKILGVTLGTHFTFGPHDRDCVERASRVLIVMKAL